MIGDIAEPPKLPNFANMSLDSAVAPAPPPAPAPKPVYKPGDKLSLTLTNSDPIFHDIRNISIERLGAYMQQKAISIRQTYNAFRENKDASLQEIADFVKKIPTITREYRLLHQHINIAEQLKHTTDSKLLACTALYDMRIFMLYDDNCFIGRDFRDYWQLERGIVDGELSGSSSGSQVSLDAIEDMIHADVDRVEFFHILRLLCLQSICSGGIRKNYDQVSVQ